MQQERNTVMAGEGAGPVVHPDEVAAYGFAWGQLALTVGPEVNGAAAFSGGVVSLPAGEGHARHNHPDADEIIFVVAGSGEQMLDDETGAAIRHEIRPGSTVYVPRARFHATLNTGEEPMTLFVVYSPAGPERALRELPDYRPIPPLGKSVGAG